MMHLDLIVWELLCAALFYSVFCRLIHTTPRTRLDVRLSIFALGIAALIGIGAPVYGWRPDYVVFVITAACLAMQIVAARHWRKGMPEQFLCATKPTEFQPSERT